MGNWRVIAGDCIEAMAAMPEGSVDAIVTDPPYGLEFMGKEWDRLEKLPAHTGPQWGGYGWHGSGVNRERNRAMQEWHHAWAVEALRALKPGGHLLAFGGTRTYHRLTVAIEDAGFEIRDCLAWLYGSGFPKSLDVGKAIDKAAGVERDVVGPNPTYRDSEAAQATQEKWNGAVLSGVLTAPATPDAERWDGWGTALKPAHEPIVMARKPLVGTVAANVLEHGTGALNVDGCRIDAEPRTVPVGERVNGNTVYGDGLQGDHHRREPLNLGRWPANVLLDPDAAAMLDEQTGERPSGGVTHQPTRSGYAGFDPKRDNGTNVQREPDTGGAARFFYVAKASSAERNAGLNGFEEREAGNFEDDSYEWPTDGRGNPRTAPIRKANVHPTVKPIDLMRWLCRLVTPPGGTVLDPFTGSGTTGCAAVLEDFDFIGIERESEYVAIAEARIAHWWKQPVQLGLGEAA